MTTTPNTVRVLEVIEVELPGLVQYWSPEGMLLAERDAELERSNDDALMDQAELAVARAQALVGGPELAPVARASAPPPATVLDAQAQRDIVWHEQLDLAAKPLVGKDLATPRDPSDYTVLRAWLIDVRRSLGPGSRRGERDLERIEAAVRERDGQWSNALAFALHEVRQAEFAPTKPEAGVIRKWMDQHHRGGGVAVDRSGLAVDPIRTDRDRQWHAALAAAARAEWRYAPFSPPPLRPHEDELQSWLAHLYGTPKGTP